MSEPPLLGQSFRPGISWAEFTGTARMLDAEALAQLRNQVADCVVTDRGFLEALLKEVAPLEHAQQLAGEYSLAVSAFPN